MHSDYDIIRSERDLEDLALTPWEGRAIIHIDLDAFFAAVIELDNPELKGKPVIVGGKHERGVVATANYEARKFGVHSAMSSKRAAALCPDAIWVSGSFDRYHEVSAEVMTILNSYTPLIERTSIDEAYCDVSPTSQISKHPVEICIDVLHRVHELGISGSIGLSNSKTVSKIASDTLKPRGLTVVIPGEEAAFLAPLPIQSLSGIGRVAEDKLKHLGIYTLGDLSRLKSHDLHHIFGARSEEYINRAKGIDARPISIDEPIKSVSNENTLGEDITSAEEVFKELYPLAEKVGWRLRKKGLKGRTISVKIKFSDFKIKTMAYTLESATDDERIFYPIAKDLVNNSDVLGKRIRLVGIGISNFSTEGMQLSLFDMPELDNFATGQLSYVSAEKREKSARLNAHIDAIRERFGYDSIQGGSSY